MKLLFLSDIHGIPETLKSVLQYGEQLQADCFVLLGDALYHGPRNGVPGAYAPEQVIALLNEHKEHIVAVRGNCDAEVDQMLLKFPISADYAELLTPERRFFATHGHIWNERQLPPVPAGTVLACGHTHIPEIKVTDTGITLFNPGSVSLPKRDFPRSFGFFDGRKLSVRRIEDGEIFMEETSVL